MDRNVSSILFVNLHYTPDIASTGQHLTDLAEYLAGAGFDVEVWCGRGKYVSGQLQAPDREERNGVKIGRLWTTAFSRSTRLGRLTNYLSFYVQVLVRMLTGGPTGLVIYLTTPPLLGFIGAVNRLVRGQGYAIWSMDLHPEAEVAAGMLRPGSFVFDCVHRLSDAGYSQAAFAVVLSRRMADRISESGISTHQIHRVSIWSDSEEVLPVAHERNPVRSDRCLGDRIAVVYSGNAGIAHRFGELYEVMERLDHDPRFAFVFVGDGPFRQTIEERVQRLGIRYFSYLDYFPRSEIRYSLSLADVHLITLKSEFAGIAVPGKLYGIMAAARPALFIGPTECETAEVILEHGCGAVIDPDREPDAVGKIVQTLREWADDPELRWAMGSRGRAAVLDHYNRDVCCSRFEEIIRQHWGGPPAAASNS